MGIITTGNFPSDLQGAKRGGKSMARKSMNMMAKPPLTKSRNPRTTTTSVPPTWGQQLATGVNKATSGLKPQNSNLHSDGSKLNPWEKRLPAYPPARKEMSMKKKSCPPKKAGMMKKKGAMKKAPMMGAALGGPAMSKMPMKRNTPMGPGMMPAMPCRKKK